MKSFIQQANKISRYCVRFKQGVIPPQKDKYADTPYDELVRDFLNPKEFYDLLSMRGIDFYTGVPDSLLKDFCGFITDHHPNKNHIIAANEGAAVGIATGYHLATNKIPLVYFQNSGIGNTVNPLLSLAHQQVYGIPMILLIGWRGEPGKKDEVQHKLQGKVQNGIITEMGIQFDILPDYIEGAEEALDTALYITQKKKTPYALLVKKQCFLKYNLKNQVINEYPLTRYEALEIVLPMLNKHDITVGATGFLSREIFSYRKFNNLGHQRDFLTVGSMGHCNSITLGIANVKTSRDVWCLDGDGGSIMHMGSLAIVGQQQQPNFKHVIFNNECHDSVGSQPTAGNSMDFCMIARGCGYKYAASASTEQEVREQMTKIQGMEGPCLLEIKTQAGKTAKDLIRPDVSAKNNKKMFMDFLNH